MILAYVVGSYSFKDKDTKPKLANKSHQMLNDPMAIPSAPHSGELSALFEDKPSNLNLFEENNKLGENKIADNFKPSELSIADDIKIIEPVVPKKVSPAKTTAKSTTSKTNVAKSTTNNSKSVSKNTNTTKSNQKAEKSIAKTENPKTKNVIEVSAPVTAKQSGSFAIQMGSFDTESKAKKMSNALRSDDYDTYIQHVRIDGKDAYRVKVGPIGDKKEAISMLNELQENDRYSDCYITKE
jgi:cell division septation protein DedD